MWRYLQSSVCSDTELDQLVGLLEDKGMKEMGDEISLGIHTPTLQGDLARRAKWIDNDYCANADWQKPREKRDNDEI